MIDRIKVLIIEDDSFLLSMYATKFELENFLVIGAENGKKGLQLAKGKKPNIILLDILLPEMDGFEVLEELKADKITQDIPVILLTNLNQAEEVKKGLTLGAEDYLIKAYSMPSEVVDKIQNVISNKSIGYE